MIIRHLARALAILLFFQRFALAFESEGVDLLRLVPQLRVLPPPSPSPGPLFEPLPAAILVEPSTPILSLSLPPGRALAALGDSIRTPSSPGSAAFYYLVRPPRAVTAADGTPLGRIAEIVARVIPATDDLDPTLFRITHLRAEVTPEDRLIARDDDALFWTPPHHPPPDPLRVLGPIGPYPAATTGEFVLLHLLDGSSLSPGMLLSLRRSNQDQPHATARLTDIGEHLAIAVVTFALHPVQAGDEAIPLP
ncbi:MAG: hypothetical protein N2557_05520 [Hydrogenophilus sp.]|nr:hypothetical protein [Hydrogenophilus sp.]